MAISTADQDFRAEYIPESLLELGGRLCAFYKVPAGNVGMRGDLDHTGGYHRSRQFLLRSPYARDRRYSVSDAPGNLGGNGNAVSAIDISLPHVQLVATCQRLEAAVRAGRLEKVAEWYGSTGDDQRVDGYDNIRNAAATSDSSHLWHLHIGIIRKHAADDHSDIYAVLTGEEDTEMDAKALVALLQDDGVRGELGNIVKEARFGFSPANKEGYSVGGALLMLLQRPAPTPGGAGAGVDVAALADAVVRKGLALLTSLTNAAPPQK